MLKKMGRIPVRIAAAAMVLLALSGVALGNRNALSRGSVNVYSTMEVVRASANGMADMAQNYYLTLADRLGLKGKAVDDVRNARGVLLMATGNPVKSPGVFTAASYVNLTNDLDKAIATLDSALREKIAQITDASERRREEQSREAAYNTWNTSRIKYADRKAYDDAVEKFTKTYRFTPMRFLYPGYRFRKIDA